MEPDAVQRENKPLECRFMLLGALRTFRADRGMTGRIAQKPAQRHGAGTLPVS